jgi:multidrug efflux pump subunit AcrA (membrane-fusion protein)
MSDIAAETATTPTETVTTQPATGDGKIQTEPAQPLRTLETAEQRIKELNAENLRLRKQADAAAKAKTDAEAAVMAEQGKFKELYQSAKAKADERDALQERLDALMTQAQAANERRINAIPEQMRSLVPEYDDPLKLAAWLDANAAVFSRPAPPPMDGRAGGNGGGPLLDEAAIKAQAIRLGLDPEGYYRQAQKSAVTR